MKTRERKQADVEQLRRDLENTPTAFVCGFEGLKVEEDFQLRNQVRENGGRYHVIQNRLARRAAEGTPFEPALTGLRGMTSLAIPGEDPVSLAKALVAYSKDHPVFHFKAGVLEGRVVDVDKLNHLATLPNREELFARLLYLINAPAQRLMSMLNAPARNLAIVVDQAVKEGKLSG